MKFKGRHEIKNSMNQDLKFLLDRYNLDDIGVYEEEGPKDAFFMGYTVKKNDKVYMVNQEYMKNNKGELAIKNQNWTIQGENGESKGYLSIEDVLNEI